MNPDAKHDPIQSLDSYSEDTKLKKSYKEPVDGIPKKRRWLYFFFYSPCRHSIRMSDPWLTCPTTYSVFPSSSINLNPELISSFSKITNVTDRTFLVTLESLQIRTPIHLSIQTQPSIDLWINNIPNSIHPPVQRTGTDRPQGHESPWFLWNGSMSIVTVVSCSLIRSMGTPLPPAIQPGTSLQSMLGAHVPLGNPPAVSFCSLATHGTWAEQDSYQMRVEEHWTCCVSISAGRTGVPDGASRALYTVEFLLLIPGTHTAW